MPAIVWVSAFELERQITAARARYTSSEFPHALHLYVNDPPIDAETVLADLVEAEFDGYEPLELEGKWEAPFQESPGRWACRTELLTWDPPAEGGSETIHGVYMQWSTQLILAARLVTAWEAEVDGDPLRLRLRYRTLAAALIEQE